MSWVWLVVSGENSHSVPSTPARLPSTGTESTRQFLTRCFFGSPSALPVPLSRTVTGFGAESGSFVASSGCGPPETVPYGPTTRMPTSRADA